MPLKIYLQLFFKYKYIFNFKVNLQTVEEKCMDVNIKFFPLEIRG